MTQITFIKDEKRFDFNTLKKPFNCDVVPQVGHEVEVRHISAIGDRYVHGVVERVLWYFSTSNDGAVAIVYLGASPEVAEVAEGETR